MSIISDIDESLNVCLSFSLPETGCLPSARIFAECILSGTRQRSLLSSAVKKTLSKIIALGKKGKKTLGKVWHSANQKKKTLGKS